MILRIQHAWKKVIVIIIAGIALSTLVVNRQRTDHEAFISDTLFIIGMLFFFLGLFHLIANMGMFNSLKYGTKCLWGVVRNRKVASAKMRDGYIDYVNSRQKYTDVPVMMLFTACFVSLSVLALFV